MLKISDLPLNEMAAAMAETPYLRRMAGVIAALYPRANGVALLAEACISPEFAAAAINTTGARSEVVDGVLLRHGLHTAAQVQAYAQMAMGYDGRIPDNDTEFENSMLALGSPLISPKLQDIRAQVPDTRQDWRKTPVWRATRSAMDGNPLVHGSGGKPECEAGDVNYVRYLRNAAAFGNLENPNVVRVLKDVLSIDSEDSNPLSGEVAWVRETLIARKDLAEDLVHAIVQAPTHSPAAVFRKLCGNPVHMRMVADGETQAVGIFSDVEEEAVNDIFFVVSPMASVKQIKVLYDAYNGGTAWLSLLLAKQCPDELYQVACNEQPEFLTSESFLSRSPWAAKHVDKLGGDAPWNVVKEIVNMKSPKRLGIRALHLAAIPMDKLSARNFREEFEGIELAAACAIGAGRSRAFATTLGQVGDAPELDIAFLFSPHTSGRQLEKLIALYPKLTAMAACHPNGTDIPLASINVLERERVGKMRETVVLAGRSGTVLSITDGQLAI